MVTPSHERGRARTAERLVETAAAAEHFGIRPDLISKWKHEKRVTPAGMIPGRGRGGLVPLYRLDDLEPHVEAYRARLARHADSRTRDTGGADGGR